MSYFHKFVEFSKAMFTVLLKIFALAPTNRRFAEKKIGLVGTLSISTFQDFGDFL